MHVLLKHRASIPDFQFLTDVLFLFLELTVITLLYFHCSVLPSLFFLFLSPRCLLGFSHNVCFFKRLSAVCLSVSPLSHILALSFSGRDVWGEAGLFAPHGFIQWLGYTYCPTACQSMVCLSQRLLHLTCSSLMSLLCNSNVTSV